MQWLYPWQNAQFRSKINNAKNDSLRTLQLFSTKNRSKKTKYSKNDTILKNGHLAKAIAHTKVYSLGKMVSLGQKLKMPKTCEKLFYKNVTVVLCKKPLEKTSNIREMRQF